MNLTVPQAPEKSNPCHPERSEGSRTVREPYQRLSGSSNPVILSFLSLATSEA